MDSASSLPVANIAAIRRVGTRTSPGRRSKPRLALLHSGLLCLAIGWSSSSQHIDVNAFQPPCNLSSRRGWVLVLLNKRCRTRTVERYAISTTDV